MNRRSDNKLSYIKEPRITKGFAFKPAAISDEVWLEMKSFHGNPRAWISGHMLNYLMRPKPWMKKILDQHEKEIDFSTPIVGVHVRRTDKLSDVGESANFIHLREFIIHVKEWYDKYELRLKKEGKSNVVERRIFLATDDPGVWDQAERVSILKSSQFYLAIRPNDFCEYTREFPEYKFLGSKQISIDASTIQSRESKNGLIGVIIDIMMLSKCDFLVCTLSSELATVAYELMQVRDWKAADNYVSLDHIYGGALAIPAKFHQAVLRHKRNNYTEELSLEFGDMLFTRMDNSSGFFYGGNNRTGKFGWYPSFKVKESTQFFSQMDKRTWEVSGGNEEKDDLGNQIKLYITFD